MEHLPEFGRPPVVETVLGAQFEPIALSSARLGVFWRSLGDAWPDASDASPLPSRFERFDEFPRVPAGFQISLEPTGTTPRLMIRNPTKDRLIQVQRDRFLYNWLRSDDAATMRYPRYSRARDEFDDLYLRFGKFLESEGLGAPSANQWEVVYVNRMVRGEHWESAADWHRLLGPLIGPCHTLSDDLQVENMVGGWHYEIAPRRGRLHIELRHGFDSPTPEGSEQLLLKLTARGPVNDVGLSLGEGLDLGRETIVRGFAAVTTAEAHRRWERTQ